MVHALEEIHGLLRPGGFLIDLHPAPSPTLIEVHHGGIVTFSTPAPGQTFEDIRHADDAIALVIEDGLFTIEQVSQFELRTYASSAAELHDYIVEESGYDEEPSSELAALQDGELAAQIQGLLQAAGEGAEVATLDPVRIARLNPVRS